MNRSVLLKIRHLLMILITKYQIHFSSQKDMRSLLQRLNQVEIIQMSSLLIVLILQI